MPKTRTLSRSGGLLEGWNDYLYPGLALASSGPSVPTLTTFRNGIKANAFVGTGSQINEGFGTIHIEHDFVAGSTMHPHIHWAHNTLVPSGDVRWVIEYSIAKGHDLMPFPNDTQLILTQTAGVQYTHQLIEDAVGISTDNLEPDSLFMFRIFRDPAHVDDTFGNDAFLFHIDLHVRVNSTFTNEKVSPFSPVPA